MVKNWEQFNENREDEIGIKLGEKMFKSFKPERRTGYTDYTALYDEWLSVVRKKISEGSSISDGTLSIDEQGVFAGNAFDSLEDTVKYVNQLKDLGATNIHVGGLHVSWGKDFGEIPYGDTLYFNLPEDKFEEAKDIKIVDETDFVWLDLEIGEVRFWFD